MEIVFYTGSDSLPSQNSIIFNCHLCTIGRFSSYLQIEKHYLTQHTGVILVLHDGHRTLVKRPKKDPDCTGGVLGVSDSADLVGHECVAMEISLDSDPSHGDNLEFNVSTDEDLLSVFDDLNLSFSMIDPSLTFLEGLFDPDSESTADTGGVSGEMSTDELLDCACELIQGIGQRT